jgi:hypothetical protein
MMWPVGRVQQQIHRAGGFWKGRPIRSQIWAEWCGRAMNESTADSARRT